MFLLLQRLAKLADKSLRKNAKIVTIICQIVLAMHFVNIYKGTLLSAYLIKPIQPENDVFAQAVSQIESGEIKLFIPWPEITLNMLATSSNHEYQRLNAALLHNPPISYWDHKEIITKLLNANKAVSLANDDVAHFELLSQNCNLRAINLQMDTSYDTYATMIVRKELINITNKLNDALDKVGMTALVPIMSQQYYREVEYNQQVCSRLTKNIEDKLSGITIINLSGPIIMIIVISIIALFIVGVEICFHRYKLNP